MQKRVQPVMPLLKSPFANGGVPANPGTGTAIRSRKARKKNIRPLDEMSLTGLDISPYMKDIKQNHRVVASIAAVTTGGEIP
jgi:hypothetical protein